MSHSLGATAAAKLDNDWARKFNFHCSEFDCTAVDCDPGAVVVVAAVAVAVTAQTSVNTGKLLIIIIILRITEMERAARERESPG